jgi:hypothetical protein
MDKISEKDQSGDEGSDNEVFHHSVNGEDKKEGRLSVRILT